MYSGQDENSGLQPVMSQQPITSGNGPIILASTEKKKSKRWLVIIGVVLFLIAIGTGVAALVLTKSKPVVTDVAKAYIEYFVYGTEGENQVNEATFEINSDDFAIKKKLESASSQEGSEYFDKLSDKYNTLQSVGKEVYSADLLKYNGDYLNYYGMIMKTTYSDLLISAYSEDKEYIKLYDGLTVDNNKLFEIMYDSLSQYAKNYYDFYDKVEKWGCLNDKEIDYNCIWRIGEENNIFWGDEVLNRNLNQYSDLMYDSLVKNLKNFYSEKSL